MEPWQAEHSRYRPAVVDVDEAVLASAVGAARIERLRRLSGGASRETWAFDAVGEDGTVRELVLRRDRPGGVAGGPRAPERLLFEAAAAARVPVPAVVAGSDDPTVLGAPFLVTAHVDGETIARRILRDDEYAGARAVLARQCGEALGRIHAIAPDAVPGLRDVDQVGLFRDVLDATGQPHPAFELGFRWLEANRPPPTPGGPRVVHGDFRNGNFIVGPDGLRAVLDWELAHLGDPMEDLGWLCVRAWRFGAHTRRVGGFGDVDDLIAGYEAVAGRGVDLDALAWWEVLGTLKWGVMCIIQAFTHLDGVSRSVELAAIGRRVCENEWDVLELIAPEATRHG